MVPLFIFAKSRLEWAAAAVRLCGLWSVSALPGDDDRRIWRRMCEPGIDRQGGQSYSVAYHNGLEVARWKARLIAVKR
jgi:hypothetical protein